jgi:hypothetical protein
MLGGRRSVPSSSADRLRNQVPRPRHRDRAAHALMPPLRWMNWSSGSDSGLYPDAYRITRDHLLRVRLSAFIGSAVRRMIAANGSSRSDRQLLQAQRPASSVVFPALGRPPRHQAVDGGQVAIDRVAVPAGLAVDPGTAEPFQALAQGRRRVGGVASHRSRLEVSFLRAANMLTFLYLGSLVTSCPIQSGNSIV